MGRVLAAKARSAAVASRLLAGSQPALEFLKGTASGTIVTVTNNAVLQSLTAITLECWVYQFSIPTYSSGARIIAYFDGSNHGFLLEATTGVAAVDGFVKNSTTSGSVTSPILSLNVWRHLAISWDGSTVRMFQDGVLVGSTALSGGNTGNPALNLTVGNVGAIRAFDGYIAEVRISKIARYIASFVPQSTPFVTDANTVLLLHLNEGSGTPVDTSGNGLTVVRGGPPLAVWTPNAGPFLSAFPQRTTTSIRRSVT